jgi:simple sugar transport system permease protein
MLAATPLLYAALGELLMERVGMLNIGIEGVLLMGAAVGYITAIESGNVDVGLLAGAATGAVFLLICYGIPVLRLGASQILVGFAVWFIGTGLAAELGIKYTTQPLHTGTRDIAVPGLSDIPVLGKVLFDQPWPVLFGVLLAVAFAFLLRRTRHGLNMRSLGEDPSSAFAAGVSVIRWRAVYVAAGGALMGFGGAVLSVTIAQSWQQAITSGRGFIALALVILAGWRPLGLLWAAYLFGVLLILGDIGQAHGWPIASQFLGMAPYVLTVAILILRTMRERRQSGLPLAPAALGRDWIRSSGA